MPLEKPYIILEIEKLLNDVAPQMNKKSEEPLNLQAAKLMYEQLEQLFRIHFEPVFNENDKVELEGLRKEFKRLSEEANRYQTNAEEACTNYQAKIRNLEVEVRMLKLKANYLKT